MLKKATIVLFALSLILNGAFLTGIIEDRAALRSTVKDIIYRTEMVDEHDELRLDSLKTYFDNQKFASEHERINTIRKWVNAQSIHLETSELYKTNPQKDVADMWTAFSTKTIYPKLTCGPRARALKEILTLLNIESRMITTLKSSSDQIKSHTFLEVFNKEMDQYEIQDPDLNLTYIDTSSKLPATVFNMIMNDLDQFYPVSDSATGWNENSVEGFKKYFDAVRFKDPEDANRIIIIYNADRMNIDKAYPENDNMNIHDFYSKYHSDLMILRCNTRKLSHNS